MKRFKKFWVFLGAMQTEAEVCKFVVGLGLRHALHKVNTDTLATRLVGLVDEWMSEVLRKLPNEDQLRCRHIWEWVLVMGRDGFGKTGINNSLAPKTAPVSILFADIADSTGMWCADEQVMFTTIMKHQSMVRCIVHQTRAYEVKTIGDSFMIACTNCVTGLLLAVLLVTRKPDGLRLRIGIHKCDSVFVDFDPVHNRYDYYGLDVNIAARVNAMATAGQILMTESTHKHITEDAEFSRPSVLLHNKPLNVFVDHKINKTDVSLKGVLHRTFCIYEVCFRRTLYPQNPDDLMLLCISPDTNQDGFN
jgi:class 3 adenylate cyclase